MKTVFVSISNPPVYRNFALFPDCVFDVLGKVPDARVVILAKKRLFPELRHKFTGKNYAIEEFEENLKKNFLQRVFYFFYSYLIFTDTTKLVSSYGVRADKARPLYKYWNYPFKWLLSRTLGRSKFIREKIVPPMYLRLFPGRPYKYLFDKYEPDTVFLPNVCVWPADLEFLVEARRRNIKTLGMPANWDHLSKYYIPFKPDKLLIWSRQVEYEALKYQNYERQNIKIVGAPQIDFLIKPSNRLPRSEFLAKVGFPENSKIIAFFSQGPYSLDGPDLVKMVIDWIGSGKLPKELRIIIRPHPSGLREGEKYQIFAGHPLVYIDDVEGWSSIPRVLNYLNVLYHSDIVLTTYSSIATEASIFDRPTIIASFDGYKNRPIYQSVRRHAKFTHFQYLLSLGGIRVVWSEEPFLEAINEYLAHPEHNRIERKKLAREVFGFLDGKNSERICREIVALL